MRIIIDNMLRLEDVLDNFLGQIKTELTIKNPAYTRKKAIGLGYWTWGSEYFKLWSERKVNGQIQYILPRGYYARLWNLMSRVGCPGHRIDKRVLLNPVAFPQKPQLRDYQAPAVHLAGAWQQGVIIMPCGAGKTETAMGIIAELEQPTLWITHTMDLLKQSMDRAKTRLGLSGDQVGIIQAENMTIGSHMTFATVQTLYKRDLSEIKWKFGCVVVDEAHLVFKDEENARMFESVISQFPACYRFGLTASEYRSDGLIETMFHIIGPKIYEVAQDDPRLPVMKPRVEFIETDFEYETPEGEMLNIQQLYKAMREDLERDYPILWIMKNCIRENNSCLALGDSLEHLTRLTKLAKDHGFTAVFVCGETPKREREKIMADMRAGKYQFLFATYQLAKLGLDIPRLDRLILITPHRDKTSIQQAVGRIMRPYEGKSQPVVYDIYDSKVRQMVFWARERKKVYLKLGCQVIGGPKVRRW